MAVARRAVVATNDARLWSEMHGLGEAKEWGLSLASAVEEFRAGRPWATIPDRAVVIGGPPGTGKDSFAVSLAKSLKLQFTSPALRHGSAAGGGT